MQMKFLLGAFFAFDLCIFSIQTHQSRTTRPSPSTSSACLCEARTPDRHAKRTHLQPLNVTSAESPRGSRGAAE
ncbi:hypothetical protein GGR52DRAFT_319119 [Hypoxylon sp. FL1284]|nr:hypothetical protein GGR52DRAFT_319119 [Hypoxylon sp. FL1284]